jgi:hypothetical protein
MPLHLMAAICVILGPYEVFRTAWDILISDMAPGAVTDAITAKKSDDSSAGNESGRQQQQQQQQQIAVSRSARWGIFILGTAVCGIVLWKGCKSHPFLLADNR